MPSVAVDTPARTANGADAACIAEHAELCHRLFGHPVRRQEPSGWWSYECPASDRVVRWYTVPDYRRSADAAQRLRHRLRALGHDVGLFAEAMPQFTGALALVRQPGWRAGAPPSAPLAPAPDPSTRGVGDAP